MGLDRTDLLPGETVLLSKKANVVIRPDEHGLSRVPFGRLTGTAGMAGGEAIGGSLHLTSYRLLFKAHPVNGLRGAFSIFLPAIQQVRNASSGIAQKVEIITGTQRCTYVVWGVPAVIAAIDRARAALDPAAAARLASLAAEHPDVLGEGLEVPGGNGAVNRALTQVTRLFARKPAPVGEPAHGEPREEPTAAEAEFGELLEELLPLALEFCFWTGGDGEPWMVAFLSFIAGPYPGIAGPEPEGGYRLVKTLRLDFDSAGIRGGWSTDNMDWDADLRAGAAGVDTRPPQGISVTAEGSTPAELARAAAEWFERHWEDWKREGVKPGPGAGNRRRGMPWCRR